MRFYIIDSQSSFEPMDLYLIGSSFSILPIGFFCYFSHRWQFLGKFVDFVENKTPNIGDGFSLAQGKEKDGNRVIMIFTLQETGTEVLEH